MIEILDFEKNLFNNLTVNKQTLTRHTYITTKKLATELLTYTLPISNKRKAMMRIFDFLNYVDTYSDDDNTLSINKQTLEDYFTRNKYSKYMSILSSLNVIHKIKQNGMYYRFRPIKDPKKKKLEVLSKDSKTKSHCIKYKLHKDYIEDNDLAIVILEENTKKDIEFKCELTLDNKFKDTIKKCDLNIPNAVLAEIDYCSTNNYSLNVLRKRVSRILGTLNNRYIKKGRKVDRIYHSFSNISRVTRKHFKSHFYEIDIVNSQPLFLVAYLKDNKKGCDNSYQNDCENGSFYERFYDLSEEEEDIEDKRKEVKQSLYQNIFFGFNKRSRYNKLFRELYTETWASLEEISHTDISLASRLQNMEAKLFNKLRPKYSTYYYTLFDAVYFTNSADKILLEREIDKFFKKLKIKVKMK
jgi:hypothetical protein